MGTGQRLGTETLVIVLMALMCVGCPPNGEFARQTTKVVLVQAEPVQTDQGIRLETATTKTIAYTEVIEKSPNVRSVTRMTDNEDPDIVLGPPILSPTEDILVYSQTVINVTTRRTQDGTPLIGLTAESSLYKQTVGSPAKTRITHGNRTDLYPAFDSEGRSIVFSSNRTGPDPMLWRVSLAGGGGITKLSSTTTEDYAPTIAAGNKAIVYNCNPPGADEPQIWTMQYNGLLPTQLREGRLPQVSWHGNKILFLRMDRDSKKKQLWVMNMDGSDETQLTSNTQYDIAHARWSPDDTKIVYASDEGIDSNKKSNFDIWMMDSDGTNKTQLTTNGSHDDAPCWDRRGRFVYFRSNRGGSWNIWRFEPAADSQQVEQALSNSSNEARTDRPIER
jgi:Tol biopolymer transport system component